MSTFKKIPVATSWESNNHILGTEFLKQGKPYLSLVLPEVYVSEFIKKLRGFLLNFMGNWFFLQKQKTFPAVVFSSLRFFLRRLKFFPR